MKEFLFKAQIIILFIMSYNSIILGMSKFVHFVHETFLTILLFVIYFMLESSR